MQNKTPLPPKPPKQVEPVKKIGTEFLIKKRYQNPMPEVPFPPKLLETSFTQENLHKWTENAMLYSHHYDLYSSDRIMEMSLDALYLSHISKAYNSSETKYKSSTTILEQDDKILMTPALDQKAVLISRHRPVVPWLRRTEYISSEVSKVANVKKSGVETRMGQKDVEMQKFLDHSREGQIRAIERTFEFVGDMKKVQALQHPTNKSLKVAEIFPVFPDWENWGNEYTHAVFDADPLATTGVNSGSKIQLEEALLKPMTDPRDEAASFVAYYTPNKQTLSSLTQIRQIMDEVGDDEDVEMEGAEGTENQYEFVRDFEHTTTHEGDNKKVFFLLRPKIGAFYNQLNTKLTLRRKRAKSRHDRGYSEQVEKPSKILVTRRKMNSLEKSKQKSRLAEVSPLENMELDSESEAE